MKLVGILSAVFLLSCFSSVQGGANPKGEVVKAPLPFGLWKRYKVRGEEEQFNFLGAGHRYPAVKDFDAYVKSEMSSDGNLVETYSRGNHKVVTTIYAPNYDKVTLDFGAWILDFGRWKDLGFLEPIERSTKDAVAADGGTTILIGGVSYNKRDTYVGKRKLKFKRTMTVYIGGKKNVFVEFFRKV